MYSKPHRSGSVRCHDVLRTRNDSFSTTVHKRRNSQYRPFCHNVKYHRVLHQSMVEGGPTHSLVSSPVAQKDRPNAAPAFLIAGHGHEPQPWQHIQHHRAKTRGPPRPLISSGQYSPLPPRIHPIHKVIAKAPVIPRAHPKTSTAESGNCSVQFPSPLHPSSPATTAH